MPGDGLGRESGESAYLSIGRGMCSRPNLRTRVPRRVLRGGREEYVRRVVMSSCRRRATRTGRNGRDGFGRNKSLGPGRRRTFPAYLDISACRTVVSQGLTAGVEAGTRQAWTRRA